MITFLHCAKVLFTRGKALNMNGCDVVFNSNDMNANPPNPSLIQKIERIHNKHNDTKMQTFKLLGVFLDEHLTLNKHVDHVTAKLSKSLYILNRVKHFISPVSLRRLYFSLFHSHLLYCINILSCTSQTNINRILLLQKKAIRIISKAHYNAHTIPLFLANKILPFDKLIQLHRLLFMHSIAYDYAPITFENTWIKNNARNTGHDLRNHDYFSLPVVRIESFRKSPIYFLAHEWNSLGDNIRLQHN
jgi:hypothetical protein